MHVAIATLTSGIGGGLSEKYIYIYIYIYLFSRLPTNVSLYVFSH